MVGKKKVKIDGVELEKVSRNMYQYNGHTWQLKGSFLTGVTLNYKGAKIELLSALPWYEYVLAIIPFIFYVVIIGGIIGALLGALSMVFSVIVFRSFKNILFKLFAFVGICVISFLILLIVSELINIIIK